MLSGCPAASFFSKLSKLVDAQPGVAIVVAR
jgi:hypothetical protein